MPATFEDLRKELTAAPSQAPPAYVEKMLHPIPKGETVDRAVWLLAACKDEVVLHVGASGPAHKGIQQVAKKVYGLDLKPEHPDTLAINLDTIGVPLPQYPDVTRIVLGEVLEHLSNPGYLLTRLKASYPGIHLIISVPNAFSATAAMWVKKGTENVNKDHVAWYSYHTLKELLRRVGYTPTFHGWYDGSKQPLTAEGLLMVAK